MSVWRHTPVNFVSCKQTAEAADFDFELRTNVPSILMIPPSYRKRFRWKWSRFPVVAMTELSGPTACLSRYKTWRQNEDENRHLGWSWMFWVMSVLFFLRAPPDVRFYVILNKFPDFWEFEWHGDRWIGFDWSILSSHFSLNCSHLRWRNA